MAIVIVQTMAKPREKEQAIMLRRQGRSVKEIAKQLNVSSGSVGPWVKDVRLTEKQKKHLHNRLVQGGLLGRLKGAEANRAKKLASIHRAKVEAKQKIRSLQKHSLFYIGLGLYWGEGVKATNGTVAIVNSDPRIIQLMMQWFGSCWGIEKSRFQARVFISSTHREREEIITRFWMKTLGLSRAQFGKMIFLEKRKKFYENHNMYYGVLTLRIARGAELRHRILAYIDQVADIGIKPA
jgi:transposase-like protein